AIQIPIGYQNYCRRYSHIIITHLAFPVIQNQKEDHSSEFHHLASGQGTGRRRIPLALSGGCFKRTFILCHEEINV
ncbi:hypothetical protein L1887_10315, partial [Cichorium endivia]